MAKTDRAEEELKGFREYLESNSMHIMEFEEITEYGTLAGRGYPLDYPIFPYYFGESNDRSKIIFAMILNYRTIFKNGICFSLEDPVMGSISLLPPCRRKISTAHFIAAGGWRIPLKFGGDVTKRMSLYEGYCQEILNKYCDDRTWYFQNITVPKPLQGKGYGGQLMRTMLGYFDSIDASCYLETHSRNNVGIYEKQGFELVEIGHLPDSDIEHYAMLRRSKSERPE